MTIQNVQLKSINGSNFQLLSVEPPLLQGDTNINLVDLDDVAITTTTNNWVLVWSSAQNKFILAPPTFSSTNLITVNSNPSNTLSFGTGFSTQTISQVSSIGLDANINLLNDVTITDPTLGDRLVFNGTQWVNSPSSAGSNTITVNSSPNVSTLVFSNQFGVNVVGNVANLSYTQTYDLDSLTDVSLTAPTQGQLLRYTGSQWENSTLAFNPLEFTVLNTLNATGISLVAQPLDWLTNVATNNPITGQHLIYDGVNWTNTSVFIPSNLDSLTDVNLSTPTANQYLSYNGTGWFNNSFNLGQSRAAEGIYNVQYSNLATTNLFIDAYSFNYGAVPNLDGWFLDFKGLYLKAILGREGYAQNLEFPRQFDFSSTSFTDGNTPTPANRATLDWRPEAQPLSRFRQILTTAANNNQFLAPDHYGVNCSGGFIQLNLPSSPSNGTSVSITDVTPSTATFGGIRLNASVLNNHKIDNTQVDFWFLTAGTTETFTFNSGNNTWYLTDKNGRVTDGDKGDIVISNSGDTWRLDPLALYHTYYNFTGNTSPTAVLAIDGTFFQTVVTLRSNSTTPLFDIQLPDYRDFSTTKVSDGFHFWLKNDSNISIQFSHKNGAPPAFTDIYGNTSTSHLTNLAVNPDPLHVYHLEFRFGQWIDLNAKTNSGSGSSLTDGDKGDITVSNSGSTWTIDNKSINFSKIQDISSGVLLGRSTSSNGNIETINIGSGLSLSGGNLSSTGSGTSNLTVFNDGIQLASNVNALDFVGDGVNTTFNNGLWTPTDILSSVNFWLEANSGSVDKSPTNRAVLNSANRGTVLAATLNNNAIFRFNNTQGLAFAGGYDPSNVTIFAVVKDDNSDQRVVNVTNNDGTSGLRNFFDVNPPRFRINPSSTNQDTSYNGTTVANNTWHLLEFRGGNLSWYNNGIQLTTTVTNAALQTVNSLANSNIVINAAYYNTSTNTFSVFSGGTTNDIAEIIVIDKTLSVAVHEQVEGYLAHKYGLTANLATNHPYKNVAPTSSVGQRAVINVTPSFGSSQTNLVEEIIVTTPVNSISFNPNNLIFGEDYQLIISSKLTAADSINIRINGDTNATGYDTQFLSVNNNIVTGLRQTNSSTIAFPTSTSSDTLSVTTFSTVNGWFRWSTQEIRNNNPDIVMAQNTGRRNAQINNFTSLVLINGTGSVNFQTGTTFRLYRLNNSTNLVNRPVQTANFTALRNSHYPIDTSLASITATLDISTNWRIGDRITFSDNAGSANLATNTGFALNNFTILANTGQNIAGDPNLILTLDCQAVTLEYRGFGRFNIISSAT